MEKITALTDTRAYRYKNPRVEFFCPCCRHPRAFVSRPRLSLKHHLQAALVSLVCVLIAYPFMGARVFFLPLGVWAVFEFAVRIFFKSQIPCPYCAFDASWYMRDVRVARKKVVDFFQQDAENEQKK